MGTPRINPMQNFAARQVASTEDMADLAKRSGFHMVEGDLNNLADNRRTAAGMPPKAPTVPFGPQPLVRAKVTRQQAVTRKAQPGDQPGSENR